MRRYQQFLDLTGITDLDRIGEETVAGFLAALREGTAEHPPLSATSAARAVVAVRGFHRFAVRDGLTQIDPAAAVRPPAPAKRLPKALPLADVEAILAGAAAPGTVLALRDAALLEVLYGTGARISEAVGLDVDDIDLSGLAGGETAASHSASPLASASASPVTSTVLLRGKGGKERIVPVGRYAMAALDAYLTRSRPKLAETGRSGPALFLNSRGGRLSRQSAWRILVDVAGRAGVTAEVSPHTLRHSYATHLLDGGADVRVVQELLGHASVTTTQVYTLVTVDKLREVYATAHPRALRG